MLQIWIRLPFIAVGCVAVTPAPPPGRLHTRTFAPHAHTRVSSCTTCVRCIPPTTSPYNVIYVLTRWVTHSIPTPFSLAYPFTVAAHHTHAVTRVGFYVLCLVLPHTAPVCYPRYGYGRTLRTLPPHSRVPVAPTHIWTVHDTRVCSV